MHAAYRAATPRPGLSRIGQSWDILTLLAAYSKIAALVGIYTFEQGCRTLLRQPRARDLQ